MIEESTRIKVMRPYKKGGSEAYLETQEIKKALRDIHHRGGKTFEMMAANVNSGGLHNIALDEILIKVVREGRGSNYASKIHYSQMFKEAVAKYQKEFFDVNYDPETDIIITNAAGHAYDFMNFCFTKLGDVYICEDPSHILSQGQMGWITYGAETKTFPLIEDDNWEPDIDQLRKIPITKNTNAITLVHPNNPVGRIHNEKNLKSIIDFAGENNLTILSDEIYADVTLDGVKCTSLAKLADDVPVMVVSSLSKFFMKPGWGIGYIAIHDPIGKIKDILTVGLKNTRLLRSSMPIVGAAAIGLMSCRNDFYYVDATLTPEGKKMSVMYHSLNLMKRVNENTEYILKRIYEIDGLSVVKPNATFYMFIKIEGIGKTWKSEHEFLVKLAKEEGIGLRPGAEFGEYGYGHYRSNGFYPIETYEEVYNKIENFIKRHKK